jgi:hypothetical protein
MANGEQMEGMLKISRFFVDLCLLRARPQDLPASNTLVWFTALATIATTLLSNEDLSSTTLVAVAQVALLGLFTNVALTYRGFPARWPQTVTALYGMSTILNLVTLPVLHWMEQVKGTPRELMPAFAGLAITLWQLAIMTHIYQQALELPRATSILLSVGTMLLLLSASVLLIQLSTG